jgi:hypothetical protein
MRSVIAVLNGSGRGGLHTAFSPSAPGADGGRLGGVSEPLNRNARSAAVSLVYAATPSAPAVAEGRTHRALHRGARLYAHDLTHRVKPFKCRLGRVAQDGWLSARRPSVLGLSHKNPATPPYLDYQFPVSGEGAEN